MTNLMPQDVDPIDVSIILINWNSVDLTSAALASLREHTTGVVYETFVIDNGTTKDAGVTELPRRFPWITFITNPTNLGFTKANNQGIQRSKGRYILLLNNDTVQTENAIGKSVQYMNVHTKVGALGIMHRNDDAERSFQPSFFPFPSPRLLVRGVLGIGQGPGFVPKIVEQDVDWVVGSFLMMRRECIDQIGLLDERYFIYEEDVDWCLQAKRAGWAVRFWPGVSMIHLGSGAAPLMRDKTLVMFRSHLSFLRKNYSIAAAVAFYLAMGGRLGLAVLKTSLRWTAGRVGWAEVGQKWNRLVSFAFLRPGRMGG